MLILAASTTYAQYPVVKKIGRDSVVLITLQQAKDINIEFDKLRDSIKTIQYHKDSIKTSFEQYAAGSANRLQTMYERYQHEYNARNRDRAIADSFRLMYMANKKIYEREEKRFYTEVRASAIVSALLGIMLMVASSR